MEKSQSITSQAVRSPAALTGSPATVNALMRVVAMIEAQGVFQHYLEEFVFPSFVLTNRKEAARHEKILMSPSSMPILAMIWKDSAFVTDADRAAVGAERDDDDSNPLNCHKLATAVAADASDLARQQKRIQAIVAAAEAYGLLVRERTPTVRCRELCGTELLHKLMLAFSAQVGPIFGEAALSSGGL